MDTSRNLAVANAIAMSDFTFDTSASQHFEEAVEGLIAELGEQGYTIVPIVPAEPSIVVLDVPAQQTLFTYATREEFSARVAMLRAQVTYGWRCPNMRDHIDWSDPGVVVNVPCSECYSLTQTAERSPFRDESVSQYRRVAR